MLDSGFAQKLKIKTSLIAENKQSCQLIKIIIKQKHLNYI